MTIWKAGNHQFNFTVVLISHACLVYWMLRRCVWTICIVVVVVGGGEIMVVVVIALLLFLSPQPCAVVLQFILQCTMYVHML